MKKQNHKSQTDLYDKSEGSHYYKKFKTSIQRKANNALDKALRQKDLSMILDDDETDFYINTKRKIRNVEY